MEEVVPFGLNALQTRDLSAALPHGSPGKTDAAALGNFAGQIDDLADVMVEVHGAA
jgi:hypothetical protein